MDTNKSLPSAVLAGASFTILALLALVNLIRFFSFGNLVYFSALVVLALAFFMSKRDILPIGGFALLALSEIIYFFSDMSFKYSLYDWYWDERSFNFFALIPGLIRLVAYLGIFVFVLIALNDIIAEEQKEKIKKLWFIPAALTVVAVVVAAIFLFIFEVIVGMDWYYGYSYLRGILTTLVLAAGFLFSAMYIFYPEGLPKNMPVFSTAGQGAAGTQPQSGAAQDSINNAPYGNASQNANYAKYAQYTTQAAQQGANYQAYNPYNADIRQAYFSLVAHILLLIFTCGIWMYIWIYRTTKHLNCLPDEEYRNPTTKLLLCMFVPFYSIYWIYKTGQRVDKLSLSKGIPSDLATICLILAIFIGIIPPILLQDKINNIVDAMNGKNVGGAAYQQPYQQPYQQTQTSAAPVQDVTSASAPVQEAQSQPKAQSPAPQSASATATPSANIAVAAEIKAYKDLLDNGAITQEEFDAKKKQLLGL